MNFLRPIETLTENQTQSGLNLVVKESVAAEGMITLTGGTFLVAMALHLGASNFQIGLLAALPILTNVFQVLSIWLVQKYNNRKAVTVLASFLSRVPLFVIGIIPFLFSAGTGLQALILLLFFHYFFGSVAQASWGSWMKDLVPERILGQYFSHRTKVIQTLSVVFSLSVAFFVDYMKAHHSDQVTMMYFIMFLVGGIFGMSGVFFLSKVKEPKAEYVQQNMFLLFKKPLMDRNFRKLLIFNSSWAFALNLAIPFFVVFMLKTIGLSMSYIIALTVVGQVSSIVSIKMWGRYTDRYSNKTIIRICAPVYIICILAMAFAAIPSSQASSLAILIVINIFSGISTAGINLAISNIAMKLAPREDAMVYISARNMIVSFFTAVAPLLGGLMADFFASHQLAWNIEWANGGHSTVLHLINLQGWNFFFVIGGVLAMLSMRSLKAVKETGEVQKEEVVQYMQQRLKTRLRENAPVRVIRTYKPGTLSTGLVRKMMAMF